MRLVNIHNKGRKIYLFCRDENGILTIKEDNSFYPYYFEIAEEGDSEGYDGVTLKKMFVTLPSDVSKQRSLKAYEADILFTKRYLLDKVSSLEKTVIKYCFIDIETISDSLPDPATAEFPVGCIRIYNSISGTRQTFRLDQYETEYEMLQEFMTYMKGEAFDAWLSWNISFDYDYLFHRIPDFAEKISPIGQSRYGKDDVLYPAGIGIVDYLQWFKKVTLNRAQSYSLDSVAEEFLGAGKAYKKVDFSTLNEELVKRNEEDVELMVRLEEKFQLVTYFDELRRLSKVDWEDMYFNSRILDMLLLQEAHDRGVALPMKPSDNEKEEFEGAYRDAFETGRFYGLGKYDLSSAYPNAIIDFCLDPANIVTGQSKFDTVKIQDIKFAKNPKALLPTVCKRLLKLKDEVKRDLKGLSTDDPKQKDIQQRYDAIKAVVNSAYGVMGNRFFRLYDSRVASATTFLVRDLLQYVKGRMEENSKKLVYADTDSVFVDSQEDLTKFLNAFIDEWGKRWGISVSTRFDFEGIFERILIIAKCRYIGYLKTPKGIKEEVKGVEAKRKDSTKFIKVFQKTLIDKILDNEPKDQIFEWIKSEEYKIKTLPLSEISFPCKLARDEEDYKSTPIFVRAMQETPNFHKKPGEEFFYIYVEPEYYYEERNMVEYYKEIPGKREGTTKKEKLTKKDLDKLCKTIEMTVHPNVLVERGIIKKSERIQKIKKAKDVLAFDEETQDSIKNVDWRRMINRNIWMKLESIFEALGWDVKEVNNQWLKLEA